MTEEAKSPDETSDSESLAAPLLCTFCGDALEGEEVESPYKDEAGDVMCDECYRVHYRFTCCWCEEDGETSDQHNMVVVFDKEDAGIPLGVYRVKSTPYYSQDLLGGGSLHEWALERIADNPSDINIGSHACGHFCIECQDKISA